MAKNIRVCSGVVMGGGAGADEVVAPSGTCQKGGTLRCPKNFGLSFSVQKWYKKVRKIIPAYFFSLLHLKIASFFIQSV